MVERAGPAAQNDQTRAERAKSGRSGAEHATDPGEKGMEQAGRGRIAVKYSVLMRD